ncbi:hypothetical protein LJC23_02810 [Desulfovibrio sp. OttesenSCG-928-I05]|nr:hypothetical protein [Desulfovibrio sp. OttesenSCG-928-I05]
MLTTVAFIDFFSAKCLTVPNSDSRWVTAEARAEGSPLGDIKRRIDGKGIVIFTLDNGGTIRDTGKKIFYSAHDSTAEDIARRYAEKKWGKRLAVDKGCIQFQPEQKIQRRHRGLSR